MRKDHTRYKRAKQLHEPQRGKLDTWEDALKVFARGMGALEPIEGQFEKCACFVNRLAFCLSPNTRRQDKIVL